MVRIVGIGDLVADLYYKNQELVGIDGGKTTSNIIANLSYLGFQTAMIGTCGSDIYGKIALDSLKRLGVDVSKIVIENKSTKRFHNITNEGKSTGRCPICNEKLIYRNSTKNVESINEYINEKDIIIIDNINKTNEEFITLLSKTNTIMIDIGYFNSLDDLSNDEIVKLLSNKFTIINMNNRVERYLLKRLGINDLELFKLLGAKMLVITRGKKGADFLYNDKLVSKKLISAGIEVDVSGAGDAFFSIILSEYIKNSFNIDDNMIDNSFNKSTEITIKVVSNIGARSHISELYKVKKIDNICTCKDVSL